jgi:hypothetical protein
MLLRKLALLLLMPGTALANTAWTAGTCSTFSLPAVNTTVIATATVTATFPTITPAVTATTYWTKTKLIMNPGVTNSPTVNLHANSGSGVDAVVIQAQTGWSSWH